MRLLSAVIVACSFCLANAPNSSATNIGAEVKPVRIIHIDDRANIVRITSNTPRSVTPVVYRIGSDVPLPYTSSLQSKYEQVLKEYDMSRPVVIQVKNTNA